MIVFGQALIEIFDLLLNAVHLINGFVYLADLIANLQQQIKLFLQVRLLDL